MPTNRHFESRQSSVDPRQPAAARRRKGAEVPEAKEMFVGPRSFQVGDRAVFFGRDREARQLLAQVFCNRLTVVYAQSGAGKTSLINATLVPRLEDEGFEVLPIARVRRLLPPEEEISPHSNIFVANALSSWSEAEPADVQGVTFKQFLQQRKRGRRSEDDELPAPRSAIFDQFEELFTSHQDRWRDRQGFFEQLRDAVEDDERLRVVLVIREEYLARLESYADMFKERFRGRFHLERLRKKAAMEAVRQPFMRFGHEFTEEAAALLVKELSLEQVMTEKGATSVAGEFVEPVQLQVVCSSMSLDLPFHQKDITEKDFKVAEVTKALSDFYTNTVREAAAKGHIEEGELRTKIEGNFITRSGTRDTRMREPEGTGGIFNAAIDTLEQLHLIRAESSRGAPWYELSHDRFIEPIRQSNREWFTEALQEATASSTPPAPAVKQIRAWLSDLEAALSPYAADLKSLASSQEDLARADLRGQQSAAHALAAHARILIDRGEEELAALLARQAYLFNRRVKEQARAHDARLQSGLSGIVDALLFDVLTNLYVSHELSEHTAQVSAVAFSPTGRLLASGSFDGTIRILDLDRRGEATILLRQSEGDVGDDNRKWIQAIALARQGDRLILASGSEDRAVRLWHACAEDRPPWFLWGHADVVTSVAFNQPQDPQWLAAGGRDGTVRIWDLRDLYAEHRVLAGHENRVACVAFNPEGNVLASGCLNGTVRLWHVPGPSEPFWVLHDGSHDRGVKAVAFHPQGNLFAAGCTDGRVRVWRLDRLSESPQEFVGHERLVESVTFSPDGHWLASGSHDQTVRIWDLNRPEAAIATLRGPSRGVSSVSFSRDSRVVAAGYWAGDGDVKFWLPPQAEFDLLSEGQVFTAACSPDGKLLACGTSASAVPLWKVFDDGRSPRRIDGLAGHHKAARAVAFSPDSRWLVTGSEDTSVRFWDLAAADKASRELGRHDQRVQAVAFSPDGNLIASVSDDKTVRLWDQQGPVLRHHRLLGHTDGIRSVAFSPDQRWLATAGRDKTIRIWDLHELANAPIELPGHSDQIRSVAFSPDGSELASASDDQTVRLWKVEKFAAYSQSSELPRKLHPPNSGFSSVGYCRGGSTLAAGNWDHEILVWDLAALDNAPLVHRPRIGPVSCLAVGPDSKWLAAGTNQENRIHMISLDVDRLADEICDKLWRDSLTREEWRRFVGDDTPYETTCAEPPLGGTPGDQGVSTG